MTGTAIGDAVRAFFGAESTAAWLVNAGLGLVSVAAMASLSAMVLVWLERKVCAHFQLRLGPMRVGWHGTLQPMADGLKLLLKERILPRGADLFTYTVAPFLPMVTAFLALAVIPFSPALQVADPPLGILYVAALSGLTVFAILIGAWGCNNKYSLLGGLRAGAQALSYEISMILVLLTVVLVSGQTSLQDIVASQDGGLHRWWIVRAPGVGLIAFVLYLVTATAELNRAPFDISEAESELTGGFHTEYSGMAFAMFFLAEYVHLLIAAALGATLFLGGYLPPLAALAWIPGPLWLLAKAGLIVFAFMWFRWTFPRLRIDQLLHLEWRFVVPASMANLFLAGVLIATGVI